MTTKIILVRHGQTDWNKQRRIQGWSDIPLNETGQIEAGRVASKLKDEKIHAIYSSPLKRAYQTAREINKHHNLNITPIDALKECGFGMFEGFTWDEVMAHPLIKKRALDHDRYHDKTGGGESIHEVYKRTSETVNNLVKHHKNNTIVLVSHGLAIKTIAYHTGAIDLSSIEDIDIKNAEPIYISYNHMLSSFNVIDFPITKAPWVKE